MEVSVKSVCVSVRTNGQCYYCYYYGYVYGWFACVGVFLCKMWSGIWCQGRKRNVGEGESLVNVSCVRPYARFHSALFKFTVAVSRPISQAHTYTHTHACLRACRRRGLTHECMQFGLVISHVAWPAEVVNISRLVCVRINECCAGGCVGVCASVYVVVCV